MAISSMNKLFLIGMRSDREQILTEIQRLSCAEIISLREEETDAARDVDQLMARVEYSLSFYRRFIQMKKPLLSVPEQITIEKLTEQVDFDQLKRLLARIRSYDEQLSALKNRIGKQESLIDTLSPWAGLDCDPAKLRNTRRVCYFVGTLEADDENRRALDALMDEHEGVLLYRTEDENEDGIFFAAAH